MWSEIIAFVIYAVWPILPEVTIGLRFVTALIGFALTVGLLERRIRQRVRRANVGTPRRR